MEHGNNRGCCIVHIWAAWALSICVNERKKESRKTKKPYEPANFSQVGKEKEVALLAEVGELVEARRTTYMCSRKKKKKKQREYERETT